MMSNRSRRVVTVVATASVAGLALAGCSGDSGGGGEVEVEGDFSGETLTVAATWSGAEQQNFEAVLDAFEEASGATVEYTSFGDNGATYLQGQLEGGAPPSVAVVGQPALLQQLASNGDLAPLSDAALGVVEENYSQDWIDLGTVDGETYGVWFKAANKSTVWYNADIYDEAGAVEPATWDEFLEQMQLLSDSGYAGIAIGADVGWPLTDWFENVYLRVAGGEKYDQLTAHEIPWTDDSVRETLEVLSELFGSDAVLPGGDQMTFPDSVGAVFGSEPEAGTVYEGDFVAGNIAELGVATVGENALLYDFPSVNGSGPAVVGGGDVAVAFDDSEAVDALMQFLASPEAAEAWIPAGGLTSPNQNVDTSLYPDEISQQIAESLTEAETFRFDMSDLAPSAFGGTPGQGFWQEMIRFYQNPDDIDGAMERLEAAAADAY